MQLNIINKIYSLTSGLYYHINFLHKLKLSYSLNVLILSYKGFTNTYFIDNTQIELFAQSI